jgi:carbohydrate-selective porin OprB
MVYSKWGSDFNNYIVSLGGPSLSDEKLFEINYKCMIAPWLQFQPVGQFYRNVGGSSDHATLAGFRLVTTF